MKIPASSFTLGQKLERYHTAVQVGGAGRLPCVVGVVSAHPQGSTACALCFQSSESVRAPGPSRAEFLVAPVDVASKRRLFEKELVGQGRGGAASSRKVSGSGVCKSRPLVWAVPDSSASSCVSLGAPAADLSSLPLVSPRPPGCAHSPSEGGGRARRPGLDGCGQGTGPWRCPPDPDTEAVFSGELAALGGCDVQAQPVDQQDAGVRRWGPAGIHALYDFNSCRLVEICFMVQNMVYFW